MRIISTFCCCFRKSEDRLEFPYERQDDSRAVVVHHGINSPPHESSNRLPAIIPSSIGDATRSRSSNVEPTVRESHSRPAAVPPMTNACPLVNESHTRTPAAIQSSTGALRPNHSSATAGSSARDSRNRPSAVIPPSTAVARSNHSPAHPGPSTLKNRTRVPEHNPTSTGLTFHSRTHPSAYAVESCGNQTRLLSRCSSSSSEMPALEESESSSSSPEIPNRLLTRSRFSPPLWKPTGQERTTNRNDPFAARGLFLQREYVSYPSDSSNGRSQHPPTDEYRPTPTSISEQRQSLPVYKLKTDLLRAIERNRILIIVGETGSGKSTQITQYLLEAAYGNRGKIVCTQPRRVAAKSLACRVARELGCRVGGLVGYKVRFENRTSPKTLIKYTTDGMLLKECMTDKNLGRYSVIILDEAHERTICNDILLAMCKEAVAQRSDLKLIISSATMNSNRFSKFFDDASVFEIPGRTYPVEIFHSRSTHGQYFNHSIETVVEIHKTEPPGDILLFLTGLDEIGSACKMLEERTRRMPPLIICPIYAALSNEDQAKIFDQTPEGHRKIIVSTNIAETSLTIDGIRYVVDCGYVKQKSYDPKLALDILKGVPISKAQAKQRTGRAGRTVPGKCYRVFTDVEFAKMPPDTVPEIQRTNLTSTILTLKAIGIDDIREVRLLDKPKEAAIVAAIQHLRELGAIDAKEKLTECGRQMAEFSLEPMLARAMVASVDAGCSEEMRIIASMLTAASGGQNVFNRPKKFQEEADLAKRYFAQPDGDHTTLLSVYNEWIDSNRSKAWCKANFLCFDVLKNAELISDQILMTMHSHEMRDVSCMGDNSKIEDALLIGFKRNAAAKDSKARYQYKSVYGNQAVYIHPSSVMFSVVPSFVICHELVSTTKTFMREVFEIKRGQK